MTRARRLLPSDRDWPTQRLAQLDDPPGELRVCGVLPPLARAVAVVGTRYADEDGLVFARSLGVELAERRNRALEQRSLALVGFRREEFKRDYGPASFGCGTEDIADVTDHGRCERTTGQATTVFEVVPSN